MADTQALRDARRSTMMAARSLMAFRGALALTDPKVRRRGFHQRQKIFRAGTSVRKGARAFSEDIVMHESVPLKLSEGPTIYSDIFLPARLEDIDAKRASEDRVPALVAWSPYGKQLGTDTLDDFPMRAGVPLASVSDLQKWEGPDPAQWCPHGYAIVNPDARGAFTSEGDIYTQGHTEAFDAAELIEWLARQPWCNGKVALAGNSWLALMQWKIASLRPNGLAAIAPWEGLNDMYREDMYRGGILNPGAAKMIIWQFAGQGKVEDIVENAENYPLWNAYWEDKLGHPEHVNVPTYAVASWASPVHTIGTLRSFNQVPGSTPKWLRIHNTQEWPDFYNYQHDLRRFFDYYLKDQTQNGWDTTPKIRLSVLDLGHWDSDIVNRSEAEWPLKRTEYVQYYLNVDGTLSPKSFASNSDSVEYDSTGDGKVVFTHTFAHDQETSGYFSARLNVSCAESSDMDMFVQIEKLNAEGWRQGSLRIRPESRVMQIALRSAHDWNMGMSRVGRLFYFGPDGRIRVSHAHESQKHDDMSEVGQPYFKHTQPVTLATGEVRAVDVPMKPAALLWKAGDVLRFTISGKPVIPPAMPGLVPIQKNAGQHRIHLHGSYLLVPHV